MNIFETDESGETVLAEQATEAIEAAFHNGVVSAGQIDNFKEEMDDLLESGLNTGLDYLKERINAYFNTEFAPVIEAPGRLRLATSPSCTGSCGVRRLALDR
jgi:hypothetical protein